MPHTLSTNIDPALIEDEGVGYLNGSPANNEPEPEQNGIVDPLQVKVKKARGRGRPRKPKDAVEVGEAAPVKPKVKSKKRKAAEALDIVEPDVDHNVEHNVEPDIANEDAGSESGPSKQLKLDENESPAAQLEGPLTKKERDILDTAVEEYRANHALGQREVNELIQNKNRAQTNEIKELWTLLVGSLDGRSRVSVMRAARRRFHNYQVRGKFTTEDDELLIEAYNVYPDKWVKIGSMLGRMPEDCRDRYRNYLINGAARKTDDWSPKEESELEIAIEECAKQLRQAAKDKAKENGLAFRDKDWESDVNFAEVSKKMNHTRSRLQCYTHWKLLQQKKSDTVEPTEEEQVGTPEKVKVKNPTRKGRALANYGKMTLADKFNILRQIVDSKPPPTEESDINWKAISRQDPDSQWTTRDRKVAFGKLKETVSGYESASLNELIDGISRYLHENYAHELPTAEGALDEESSFNAEAARALQQELDKNTEDENSMDNHNAAEAIMNALPEQDIEEMDVARTLQGIAQQSQAQGDFVASAFDNLGPLEDPAALLYTAFPAPAKPAAKRGRKKKKT